MEISALKPTKIIAVHINYPGRAAEKGRTPTFPGYFMKPASAVAHSGDDIIVPAGCELLTFEGEIAAVIGQRTKNISPDEGWAHVGWITAANDVGIHDLRYADRGSNLRAKGSDGFAPMGPRLLDAREIDPSKLRIRTWLNDEVVQDSTTEHLLYQFGFLVADISRTITLEKGDVILTGTPAGAGVAQPGDTVAVEVTSGALSTGRLENKVAQGEALSQFGAPPKVEDADRREAYGSRWQSPTG